MSPRRKFFMGARAGILGRSLSPRLGGDMDRAWAAVWAAKGRDNQLRGSCPDNFFIWARVFCLHVLTSESYQIVCICLPVSRIRLLGVIYSVFAEVWTHGKDPSPNPSIIQDISLPVSLGLSFQTANFLSQSLAVTEANTVWIYCLKIHSTSWLGFSHLWQ